MNYTKEAAARIIDEQMSKLRNYHGLDIDTNTPDEGKESVLQGKVRADCDAKGYPYISFKQSKKAKGFLDPGWPDMIIALPGPRTVWIEDKTKDGRLTKDQKGFALMLLQLKHEWYEIRSYKRWIEIRDKKI